MINRQNDGRINRGQLAPGPDDVSNKYHENVYEKSIAQPRDMANRTRRDHEELRASEGLARQAAAPFYGGVDASDRGSNHLNYEVQYAGQADGRSPLSDIKPTWAAVPGQVAASFAQGADFGDPGRPGAPFAAPRDGARANLAPSDGLVRGERQNNAIVTKIADGTAPWRSRRNEAEVTD